MTIKKQTTEPYKNVRLLLDGQVVDLPLRAELWIFPSGTALLVGWGEKVAICRRAYFHYHIPGPPTFSFKHRVRVLRLYSTPSSYLIEYGYSDTTVLIGVADDVLARAS